MGVGFGLLVGTIQRRSLFSYRVDGGGAQSDCGKNKAKALYKTYATRVDVLGSPKYRRPTIKIVIRFEADARSTDHAACDWTESPDYERFPWMYTAVHLSHVGVRVVCYLAISCGLDIAFWPSTA